MATTINAGRVRFVSRGTYNNSTQYYLFDLVNYNGSSYIAKENSLGNLPTNTQYWQLIAEKGNTGNTGQTGPVGPTGNGIASIRKTGTSGLVDTYTITYTNGNTTTFTVTNGEDANTTEITNLKNENAYLQNVVKQAFTEKTASGTELTIDNTIEARMEMKLNGNTSQNGEPTPATPQDIEVVTGNNKIIVSGKNLLPPDNNTSTTINGVTFTRNSDGSVLVNGTATANAQYITSKNFMLEDGKTYILSGCPNGGSTSTYMLNINQYYNNTSHVLNNIGYNQKFTYVLDSKNSNSIYIYIVSGTKCDNLLFKPMVSINGGDYEPYVGRQDFPISLGSLELCKIGDYQDYFYKKDNKWYKHKAINKNTLNGNEKWHFGNTKTNYTNLFTSSFQNDIKMPANNNINSNTLIYCDKFSNNTNASQQWVNDTMSSVTINNGKNITFNIPNSIATTTDEFKTYLISNNITLYYVLATPIEEEIIDTTLITQLDEISQALSKKGTTIISQSNDDLPFNLDVIALTK